MSSPEEAHAVMQDLLQDLVAASGTKIMWAVRSQTSDWSKYKKPGDPLPKVWGWYHGTNGSSKNLTGRMCYSRKSAAERVCNADDGDRLVRVAIVPLDPINDPPLEEKTT